MCADGLQLCDAWESSKYGAAQCLNLGGGCQGSTGDNGYPNCYPFDVWSGRSGSGGVYYWRGLNNGSFNENTRVPTYAFSVRCVLDLTTADGLQLCDWGESSKYGAARCGDYGGGCQGSIFGNCHANHVWSSSQVGSYYQIYQLNGGYFGYNENTCGNTGKYGKCALTYPFSVRCVLDLNCILIVCRRFTAMRGAGEF